MTKGFPLLPGIESKLEVCWGFGFGFFSSKSKDDTHQPNREPDHKPCVSGLSADNAVQRDPAPPQHRGSILASPKRDLGRKLITITKGCDSWKSSESRDNAEISAGKKCKKLADLA